MELGRDDAGQDRTAPPTPPLPLALLRGTFAPLGDIEFQAMIHAVAAAHACNSPSKDALFFSVHAFSSHFVLRLNLILLCELQKKS